MSVSESERTEGLFATSRGLFAEESQLHHVGFVTGRVRHAGFSFCSLSEILGVFLDWGWRSTHSGFANEKSPEDTETQQILLPDL